MRVLAGPPGAGKSRYAYAHLETGGVVIDPDEIYRSLTGKSLHHRNRSLRRMVRGAVDELIKWSLDEELTGWLLTCDPRVDRLRILAGHCGGPVHVLMPDRRVVMQRVMGRPRMAHPDSWSQLVDRWYRTFRWDPEFIRVAS